MSLFFPTLTTVPDFSEAPRRGTATIHDRTAMGTATQTAFMPMRRPDYLFHFRFAFDDAAAVRDMKEFFRARGGRAEPFYFPSWRRDIRTVGVAAAGTQQITIQSPAEDYEATHLTGTDADHYGRQLFFWRDGETVWMDSILRVLPSTTPGEEILDMDNPLPFDVDDDVFVGWAYLVRFTEDRLEWKHFSLDAAEVSIGFRGMRQANQNEVEVAIEQVDQYGQLGFVSCAIAPGDILPVTNRVAYASGPETLRASQDDPYSMPWAAYPSTGGMKLRKAIPPDNETIWLPQVGGTPSILFDDDVDTDHVALAFDQNGYEVIAYQKTATTIECRRYFNTEVEIVEWDGIDPVLQFNGLLDEDLPTGDTDVVAYYLKPGENVLYARFQRDNFGTEYVAALLPVRPVALKRATFDIADDLSEGTLLVDLVDPGFRVATLSSAAYPAPAIPLPPPWVEVGLEESGRVSASIASGSYTPAVVYADGGALEDPHDPFADAGTATAALSGAYDVAVVYADGGALEDPHDPLEDVGTATASLSGSYDLQVFSGEDLSDTGFASMSVYGELILVVIFPPISDENANVTASLSGVYEPA